MTTEEEDEQFKTYLKLRYNRYTVYQYFRAYLSYADRLISQKDIDNFLVEKSYNKGNNPFYTGFLKAFKECFKLPFEITKSKKKNKAPKKTYKFLSKYTIDGIIENTTPRISLLVRLYWETGLRLRELINAHWDSIDLEERTISGIGKGNKPFKVKFSKGITKRLYKYLNQNQREQPFHEDDSKKDHAKAFWYKLKKECKELGIENMHPHRIRHSLGRHLRADKGFDLVQVKKILRHSSITTTEIYADATEEEVQQKMENEVFNK